MSRTHNAPFDHQRMTSPSGSATNETGVYIIPDPQHEYAIRLIEIIAQNYGLRPVFIYSSSREAIYRRPYYPELQGANPAEVFYLDRTPMAQIAAYLKARYQVVGIVPYFEQSIGPMAQLADMLGVPWNDKATLERFRDKYALKAHIARQAPDLPLGIFREVKSPDDVWAGPLPSAYVIKPSDGAANRDIGFFDATSTRADVAQYFSASAGARYTLEERFIGEEYAVNGQVDATGEVIIVNMLHYERVPGNGKPNLYHRTHHVKQVDKAFAPLASYAASVLRHTGLVRCPFHMEVMLTAAGPRLIEVAARFGGTRYAFMSNDVHGGAFDVFALAAHYYLFTTPYTGPEMNWDHYDRVSYVHLDGISHKTERIYHLEGIEAIEALPSFMGWVVKPKVGDLLRPTISLYTVPYSFHLMSTGTREELVQLSEEIKRTLRINSRPARVTRAWVSAKTHLERRLQQLRWMIDQGQSVLLRRRG